MCEEGDWEAMVRTMLTLYDAQGERQHTIYLGSTQQHKADYLADLKAEIAHVKSLHPQVTYVGIADSAGAQPRALAAILEQDRSIRSASRGVTETSWLGRTL